MADIHVDLYNGDDANDGSTWALARKTISGAEGIQQYKVAKTPAGIVQAYEGTWSETLPYVELDSEQTKTIHNIDTAGIWKMTSPYTTTSVTGRKIGASSQGFVFNLAATYPTGKIAYLTLPTTVDGSNYSKIAFWFNNTNQLAASTFDLRICLCSDTLGNTILKSFSLEMAIAISTLNYNVIDNGAALPSNINSVAIYLDSKTSQNNSANLYFNHLILCNDLHCDKLISPQAGYHKFRAIKCIVGTRVYLEDLLLTNALPAKDYGDTEITNSVYLLECFHVRSVHATQAVLPPIVGGYNTSTDEVDGYTFIDGAYSQNGLINCGGTANDDIKYLENVGIARVLSGSRSFLNAFARNCIYVSCQKANSVYGGNPANANFLDCYAYGLSITFFSPSGDTYGLHIIGLEMVASGIVYTNTGTYACYMLTLRNVVCKNSRLFDIPKLFDGLIYDCSSSGNGMTSRILSGDRIIINECNFGGTNLYYQIHTFDFMTNSIVSNCVFEGNVAGQGTYFHNCIMPYTSSTANNVIAVSNFGQNEGANGLFQLYSNIKQVIAFWQTDFKRDVDDLGAWAYYHDYNGTLNPKCHYRKVFDFAYKSGSPITIKIWIAAYGTILVGAERKIGLISIYPVELVILKDVANGIISDIVGVKSEVAEWEQMELSFSATKDGVYSVYSRPYASGTLKTQSFTLIGPIEIVE